jgi:hypothetical protein
MDESAPVHNDLDMTNVGDDFLEPALQPVRHPVALQLQKSHLKQKICKLGTACK